MFSKPVSVVVIGASHAGLGVSHKLLRQAPKASITLIDPSDEYYFNIATPRFLVKPQSLPSNKYLYDIRESFIEYPSGSFNFVKGLVTRIDYSNKSVLVTTNENSTKNDVISVAFDYLVIASGSTTPATLGQGSLKLPFKATAFEDTRKAISEAQNKLQNATRIVIGGAGPLGVELAGELAEASGSPKVITLVSKTGSLLEGATDTVQRTAESILRRKNVEILKNVTVDEVNEDTEKKSWTVKLSTGQTITADEYISTTGVIPNNQFIPKSFLNDKGWVNVDEQLRVVEGKTSRSDTYAVGDITCHPYRLLSRVSIQAATVASNIAASIKKDTRIAKYSAEAQRKMMVVPVGQSTGTGHFGGWTLLGCLVWFFKGKDFLTYEAPKFLRGKVER
jgi:NADH dehydrogenase FAD-containing subunit